MTAVVSTNNKSEVATAEQVTALAVTPAIETLARLKAPTQGQQIVQEVQLKLSNYNVSNEEHQNSSKGVPITEQQMETFINEVRSVAHAIVAQNTQSAAPAPTAAATTDAVAGAAREKEEKEETKASQSRVVRSLDGLADFLEAFSKGRVDPNRNDPQKPKKKESSV